METITEITVSLMHPIQNMIIDVLAFIICPKIYIGLVGNYVDKYLCFGALGGK